MMKNLKLLRIERGLTQIELARKIGVSQFLISSLERGTTQASPDLLIRLTTVLDVDPGLLMVYEGKITFDEKKVIQTQGIK